MPMKERFFHFQWKEMICDALSFPWAIMQLEWIGLKIKLQGLFEKIKKVCFKNISFKAISSFFVREGPDGPNQWQRENQIDVWRWIEWKLWQIRSIKFEVNIRWRNMGGDQSTQMESHFWRLIFIRLIKKLSLFSYKRHKRPGSHLLSNLCHNTHFW